MVRAATDFVDSIHIAGSDVLIRGTRIEAHRIAALLKGGMTVDDVLRDFPSLSREQVSAAQAYAAAHPETGRPFPPVTTKSALRGIDLGRLDEFE